MKKNSLCLLHYLFSILAVHRKRFNSHMCKMFLRHLDLVGSEKCDIFDQTLIKLLRKEYTYNINLAKYKIFDHNKFWGLG